MKKNHDDYYLRELKDQVREWEEEINRLEDELDDTDWEAKIDYKKKIADMRIALDAENKKIHELAGAGSKDRAGMIEEIENDLARVGASLQKAETALNDILIDEQ